jgi:hypothetical protein
MNAFEFLGQERIDALKKGGMSDIEIRDYAKNKWLGEQNTPKVTDEPSLNIKNYDENLTNQATTDKPAKPQIEASDAAAQKKDSFSKLGDEIINEINPRASEPQVQNLGADGLPIPQAPIANETASEKSFFQDAYDAVEGFVKGAKKTAKAVYEDSIFGDYGTGAGKDDKAKVDIAKAQNTNGLISTLLQSDDEKAAERKKLQSDYDEIAKKYGYDLGAIVKGENIYFVKTAENGEIKTLDVTPSFTNQIAANKGEILGSIGAGFLPGGLAAKVGYSAIGAGAGAMRDRAAGSEALGREVDTADMIKRGLQASADDLAAAAVIGGVVKGAQAAYRPALNATKATLKTADYIADKIPLVNLAKNTLKGIPTANVEGGLNAIKSHSRSVAEEMLQRGERVGGYSVDNDNLTDLAAIADKPIKFVKEHLAKTADKLRLDGVSEFINNAEGMNVKQKKILDLGLSDTGSAGNILNAIRADKTGKSAENLAALAKSDVEAIKQILPSDGEIAKGELSGTLREFFARVKDEFGAMEDDISAKLAGKKTTLNSDAIDAAKKQMDENTDVFYNADANEKLYKILDGLKNKEFDFNEFREFKKSFNRQANQIYSKENGYFTKVDTSNVGKIIDDALFRLLDNDKPLKELYLKELKKYSEMKNIEAKETFQKMLDENIDEDKVLDLILSAEKSQGDLYNAFVKNLNKEELERFEGRILNSAFKSQIWEVGKGEVKTPVFDGIGLEEILRKLPIKSPKAAQIKDAMMDMAIARRNVAEVLVALDKSASTAIRPRAGIATTAEGAAKALWINVLKQKAFKYIGKLGDDAALEYHLQEALKALKLGESLKSVKQNLKNSGIDERVADAVNTSVKEFEYLSKKMDTNVKFGENLAKTNPNLYQGLMEYRAIDMPKWDVGAYNGRAASQAAKPEIYEGDGIIDFSSKIDDDFLRDVKNENLIAGESANKPNFGLGQSGATKSDLNVKVSVEDWVRELSEINNNELSANLFVLQNKHPELFKKPADVYRLLIEVKNNPTYFFKNNRPDMALMAKILKDGSLAKMAVVKDNGKIGHLTKSTNKNELDRLRRVNNEELGAGSPAPALRRAENISGRTDGDGANAHSLADESIIPQNEQNIAKSAFLKNGNLAEEENLSALRAKIERENNITPIKDFGINYAEFYHDGVGAVNKLLAEKRGQVAGAFYRKELGDIDLVWGNEQIGLNKILSKHEGDFKEFGGVASGLGKIVKDGRIADKNGVLTIFREQNGKTYAVGLSKGWFGEGDNKWVITAYEKKNLGGRNETLSAYASLSGSKTPEPTAHNGIIPQNENLIDKEILDDIRAWDDESVPNENYAKQIIEKDGEEYHITDKNHNNFSLEELKDKDNYTLLGGVVNQKMSGKEIKEFFAKADNDIMSEENLAKGANDGNQERGRQSGGDSYRRGNTEIRGQREGRSSDDVVSKQDGRDDVGGIRGVNQEAGARSELANDNPHSLSSDGDAYADAGGRLPRGDELRDRRIHAGYDTKNAGVDEGGRQARVKPEDERLRSPFEDFTAKIDENLDLSKLKEPTKGKDAFSSALNEAKILTPSEAARVKDYHIDAPRSYGGEIERLNENIEAITTLKELEKSGAIPTKEQQEILSRYNGWGGLSQAFDENNPKLGMRSKAFLDTLSDEELQSAKSSVNSSFYTPHDVVERIYDQVERLGFKGGEVLEPSVGIGNFFGLMPRNLKDASNLTGVEIDNLTARIARKLYPNAQIINEGYQKFNPIKKYDLVISNPPFSSSPIYDNVRKNLNGLNMHSYFALKNLELTKENGLNVLVVTHSLADSKEGFLRSEIDRLSKIVSAVRLPSNGFKDTATVTDVFFLVKRSDEEIAKGIRGGELNEQFLNLAKTVDKNGNEIEINGLFANNPRLVMGDSVLQSGRFGDEVAVKIDNRYELAGRMKRALDETDISGVSLNKGEIVSEPQRLIKAYEKYGTVKGSVFEHNGKFYKKRGEYETDELKEYELLNLGKDTVEYSSAYQKRLPERLEEAKKIVKAVDGLRETLFKLKSGELSGDLSDGELGKLRSELGKRYADFKKDFGYISNPKIAKIYEGDPTYSHLSALEKGYKREKINGKIVESADRADIFSKRVLTPYVKPAKASSIEDATKISLNEYGRIDYERIGSLLGKDADAVKKEILDKKLGFLDENENIVEKDEFLSGNVKQKLARLEANNEDGSLSGGIEEIKKVIPQDIQTADIGINAGANWIPKDVYQKFMRENIGSDGLTYDKWNGWKVDGYSTGAADANFGVIGEYKQVSAADVWEAAMNNTFLNMDKSVKNASGVTQTLRDEKGNLAVKNAIRDVKRAFEEFVLNDDEINKRVGKIYNDLFNTDVLKSYDGSYLTLPGKNENINLRTHQSNAVSRIITQNNTLLDHTVGTGKTYTMISAAMELRRLKLANKPLIVAPKAVVEQWGKEFATLYPNANVLTITEFDAASRKKTVASISAGDWDAVILSHDNFGMLKIKPETEARFINEEIKELEAYLTQAKRDGETGRINVKGLQQSLDNRRAKLEAINSAMDKDEAYFEDLGVDALFVDEAHMYKNLGFYTKMNRIKGLGNAKGSQRANDMFNKTRILNENGKKIVFATGTPIVNTIAELYTMQRYLGLNELNRLGITNFDEWAKLYGKVESDFEITPLGKYELKERFSSFVNLPELVKKYGYFADSIDGNDVKAALESEGKNFTPPVEKIRVLAGRSKDQTEYMKLLDERYEALKQKSGKPQKGDDNALSITNDAKKASLDMRLIDPLAPDFEGSKVNLAVKNAIKIYRRFQGVKGTQLICCDLSTPKLSQKTRAKLEALKDKALKGDEEAALKLEEYADEGVSLEDSFSVYEDMREKLIKGGVKEDEIAFIHDYDTDVKRKELFEKVNSGDIRIVFGSTKKIGTGVNIQKRITALHNLDVPWTPADLIQRVGRVERQGNELLGKIENFNVKVFDYATENMLDAMNWQTIETKLKFINQLKKGESAKRTAEDLSDDVVDAATMKALASGNPDILKEIELRREIDELNADRIRWHKANAAVNDRAGYLARQIESLPGLIADIGKDADSILPKDEKNFFTVGGKSYEAKQREKALTDINDALKRLGENKSAKIGEYRGFDVVARKIYLGKYKISLQNNSVYELSDDIGLATSGFFTRLDNALNSVSKELNAKKALIPAYKKELGGLKGALKPWGRENELRMLNKRHDEIMLRLKEKE